MQVRTLTPAFFAACVIVTSAASSQRVLKVPTQYETIQAAIDAAKDKDAVLVAPGRYVENIDFKGKAIAVASSGGSAVTTIDGGERGPEPADLGF